MADLAKINGVAAASVAKVNGVAVANIANVMGATWVSGATVGYYAGDDAPAANVEKRRSVATV